MRLLRAPMLSRTWSASISALSLRCLFARRRKEFIADLPHLVHVELVAFKDDLAALLVFSVLEGASHVHPADGAVTAHLVLLADDEIHIDRLADPVFEVPLDLHVEDFAAAALAGPQVGVPALELDVDPLPAGSADVVLELQFAVDADVEHRHRSEDLVRLAGDGHHVTDQDLLQSLRVEFARGRLFHRRDLAGHGIALEPLLDAVPPPHDQRDQHRLPLAVEGYGLAPKAECVKYELRQFLFKTRRGRVLSWCVRGCRRRSSCAQNSRTGQCTAGFGRT